MSSATSSQNRDAHPVKREFLTSHAWRVRLSVTFSTTVNPSQLGVLHSAPAVNGLLQAWFIGVGCAIPQRVRWQVGAILNNNAVHKGRLARHYGRENGGGLIRWAFCRA
jgi:hypothetical protein